MPFKDADKEREYRKQQARRRRAEVKLRKMGGNPDTAPRAGGGALPDDLTQETWKAQKLAAGWDWWARHKDLLRSQPIAAVKLAMHAMALIDANLGDPEANPEALPPGLEAKAQFLADPEYRRLLQQLAVREGQLRDQEG